MLVFCFDFSSKIPNLFLDRDLLEEFKQKASDYKYACKQLEIFIIQIIDHQNKISGPEFPRSPPTVTHLDVSNTQQTPNKDTNAQAFMSHLNMQRAHQVATGIIPAPVNQPSPSTPNPAPFTPTVNLRTSVGDLRRGSAPDNPTSPLRRVSCSRETGIKRSTSESTPQLTASGSARQNPSLSSFSQERGYSFLFLSCLFSFFTHFLQNVAFLCVVRLLQRKIPWIW